MTQICPICSGNMAEKVVPTVSKDANNNPIMKGSEKVWSCRDCHRVMPIK